MADKEYGLKFTTTAETGGAQQAAQSVQQVGKAAEGTQQKLQGLSQQERDLQAAAGQLNRELHQQTNRTDQLTSAKSRLADGLKKLGNEVPVLGAALNALKNPWTAIAFVIGAAVIKVREMIAAQNELARQGANLSAALDPVVLTVIRQRLESEKVKTALDAHAAAMDAIAQKANSAETALSRYNAQVDRETKLGDAQDELDTAKAIAANPDQADALRAGLAQRREGRRANAEMRKASQVAKADLFAQQDARLAGYELPGAIAEVESIQTQMAQRKAWQAAAQPSIATLTEALAKGELTGKRRRDPLVSHAMSVLGIGQADSTDVIRSQITAAQHQSDEFAARNESDDRRLGQARSRVERLQGIIQGGGRFTEASSQASQDYVANRDIGRINLQRAQVEQSAKEVVEASEALAKSMEAGQRATAQALRSLGLKVDQHTKQLESEKGR